MTTHHSLRVSFKTRIAREAADRVAVLLNDFVRWFDPDQPRTPAGQPGGGQWVGGNHLPFGTAQRISLSRRSIPADLAAECNEWLRQDIGYCWTQRFVRFVICEGQAMERYAACLTRKPIPPLLF